MDSVETDFMKSMSIILLNQFGGIKIKTVDKRSETAGFGKEG